jgi:TolB-like protein
MGDAQEGALDVSTPAPAELKDAKPKKKKDKVRSAWISFVGRIIAQILGAVATITLGLAVADRISRSPAQTSAPAALGASPAFADRFVPPDSRPSVAVLPLELFSPDSGQQYLADSLTEEIIAALASEPALRVVSRTSALQYRQHPQSVPEIARALGVDIVVEGCVVGDGDTIGIRLRVIDGAADTHVGTVERNNRVRDTHARRERIASDIARELTGKILAASLEH